MLVEYTPAEVKTFKAFVVAIKMSTVVTEGGFFNLDPKFPPCTSFTVIFRLAASCSATFWEKTLKQENVSFHYHSPLVFSLKEKQKG